MRQENLIERAPVSTDEPREEPEIPGVIVQRRFFLSSISAAALFLGLPKKLLARDSGIFHRKIGGLESVQGTGATKSGDLGWEEFLAQGVPLANQLLNDSLSNQDAYLYQIASLATRLKGVPETKLYPFGGLQPPVAFAPSYKGPPFAVIQWRMAPGAVLPAHNHPNYSVCTLGVEGQARLRNFEIVGAAPDFSSKKSFLIRETHNQFIGEGRIATLSPTRDNIHQFEAGEEGARGIDITTLYGKDVGFSFIDMESSPKDPEKGIFDAAWIGMNPKNKT